MAVQVVLVGGVVVAVNEGFVSVRRPMLFGELFARIIVTVMGIGMVMSVRVISGNVDVLVGMAFGEVDGQAYRHERERRDKKRTNWFP